ncbi:peroxynitrite isomerase THAP4-like [Ixodes scapularis]|uniref:peroxynitrite isomerase THAP4-like n=1 Tax=Ixodes scapularis TaxID=6945 RepID=UPI001A9E1390|nr:peroxynitrite isomerase THAP4-like [Ixodes scapularis]
MPQCCASGCTMRTGTNKMSEVKFFRFPRDEGRRRAWATAVRRVNFLPNNGTRICSKHFTTGRPSKDPDHPDWVPHIFAFKSWRPLQNRSAVLRYQRAVSRRQASLPRDHTAVSTSAAVVGSAPSEVTEENSNSTTSERTVEETGISCSTDLTGAQIEYLVEENRRLRMQCDVMKRQFATFVSGMNLKSI